MIRVQDVTYQYPSKKGVFQLNFEIAQGEVRGYLGPNGAGKTTTIRQLIGFMKPQSGICTIQNKDCFDQAHKIHEILGYIPGEISFLEGLKGNEYLSYMRQVHKIKDTAREKYLCDLLEFSPKGEIKKYSKGMKQKLGIIAAFLHDPEVLILDEPTSGLDPLMQNRFIQLILEEKKKGKTILISSHIFEEIEKTCDNVLIIKEGKIVENTDILSLKAQKRQVFLLQTDLLEKGQEMLRQKGFNVTCTAKELEVQVQGGSIDKFAKALSQLKVLSLETKHQSLEDVFMKYYQQEGKHE